MGLMSLLEVTTLRGEHCDLIVHVSKGTQRGLVSDTGARIPSPPGSDSGGCSLPTCPDGLGREVRAWTPEGLALQGHLHLGICSLEEMEKDKKSKGRP